MLLTSRLPIKPLLLIGSCWLTLEALLLIGFKYWLGWHLTLILILFSTVAGLSLLLTHRIVFAVHSPSTHKDNQEPSLKVFWRFGTITSALLLIIPGFFTTALGMILLIPHLRHRIIRRLSTQWILSSSRPDTISNPAHDPNQQPTPNLVRRDTKPVPNKGSKEKDRL